MNGSKAYCQKVEQEGRPQNNPPILREGVGDKYSCTRKGVGGGGGGIEGTGNSKSVD